MRILISAVNFNEGDRMASQRPRALSEMLARRGHQVTVLTMATPPEETAPYPPGVEVIETVPYDETVFAPGGDLPFTRRLLAGLSVLPSAPEALVLRQPRLSKLFGLSPEAAKQRFDELNTKRHRTASGTRAISEDHKWYRESVPVVVEELSGREPYDAVFATYSTHGSVWLGKYLHSKGVARNLIVDFRDLMDQPGSLLSVRRFQRHQQRKALRQADAVTVVSEGLRDDLLEDTQIRKHAQKIKVLYNGFLRNGLGHPAEPGGQSRPLKIAYTGSLYRGRRDVSALFLALNALRGSASTSPIEVHYAGPSGELFRDMAQAHGVDDMLVDHGLVPRDKALLLQEEADLLLVLSWNAPGNQGVLSGKFPEYLGANKPIISIVMGSLPNAELTTLVKDMNVGATVEESTQEEDVRRLTDYLQRALDAKRAGKPVPHNPVASEVEKFNYAHLAERLEEIVGELDSQPRTEKRSSIGHLLRRHRR